MNKKYILIDAYNLFFRAMHSISEREIEVAKSYSMQLLFSMLKKACDKFNPDHMVVCCDGKGTWRKKIYPQYKANRVEKLNERTPYEIEKETELKRIFEEDFLPFLKERTNVSVLQLDQAEADDLICGFINLHKDDINIIVSTDNDFVQLINENVFIYNSMEDRLISNTHIIETIKNKPLKFTIKDGKVSVPRDQTKLDDTHYTPMKDWIEYALFSKCVRGDKSDNIFSAYPGVREKSTKSKVGLLEVFNDRHTKGYAWNTFMNSKWTDAFGDEHNVGYSFEFNKKLVDLNEIPEYMKESITEHIREKVKTTQIKMVNLHLSSFLEKWNLVNLSNTISSFSGYFSKPYKGVLSEVVEEKTEISKDISDIMAQAFL